MSGGVAKFGFFASCQRRSSSTMRLTTLKSISAMGEMRATSEATFAYCPKSSLAGAPLFLVIGVLAELSDES